MGKARIVNARFAVMCAHYLYDPDLCSAWLGLGEARRREECATQPPARVDRRAADALWQHRRTQGLVGERCRQRWTELKQPEHKQLSVAEVLEQERLQMMPMPAAFDSYVEEVARVSSTCMATVARKRYSVPCELARQMLSTPAVPHTGDGRGRRRDRLRSPAAHRPSYSVGVCAVTTCMRTTGSARLRTRARQSSRGMGRSSRLACTECGSQCIRGSTPHGP